MLRKCRFNGATIELWFENGVVRGALWVWE
jgi:hypothetical protein